MRSNMDEIVNCMRPDTRKIHNKIERENARSGCTISADERPRKGGSGTLFSVVVIIIAIALLSFLSSSLKAGTLDLSDVNPAVVEMIADTNYADLNVVVDTTHSGVPVMEKMPCEKKLRAHYLKVVTQYFRDIQSDSLDQDKLMDAICNIGYQCIFANRLSDEVWVSPYNMVSLFVDDPSLQYKLVCLLSGYNRLAINGTKFTIDGVGRFNNNGGEWYFMASEAEVRPVSYEEMSCLVMGVDYSAPKKVEKTNIAMVDQPKKRNLPGLATVEP